MTELIILSGNWQWNKLFVQTSHLSRPCFYAVVPHPPRPLSVDRVCAPKYFCSSEKELEVSVIPLPLPQPSINQTLFNTYFQKTSSFLIQLSSPFWSKVNKGKWLEFWRYIKDVFMKRQNETFLLYFSFSTQQRKQESFVCTQFVILFLQSMLLLHICNVEKRQWDV